MDVRKWPEFFAKACRGSAHGCAHAGASRMDKSRLPFEATTRADVFVPSWHTSAGGHPSNRMFQWRCAPGRREKHRPGRTGIDKVILCVMAPLSLFRPDPGHSMIGDCNEHNAVVSIAVPSRVLPELLAASEVEPSRVLPERSRGEHYNRCIFRFADPCDIRFGAKNKNFFHFYLPGTNYVPTPFQLLSFFLPYGANVRPNARIRMHTPFFCYFFTASYVLPCAIRRDSGVYPYKSAGGNLPGVLSVLLISG